MKAHYWPLPRLDEELRHRVCARILDTMFALDEGRTDLDMELRLGDVFWLLWRDNDIEPLMPEVNRLRANNRVGPVA